MRVAIIGAGVSGLVAARALYPRHEVTVFEAGSELGGHAHTVQVDDVGTPRALDVGFVVYNERTYPLFTQLLDTIGVASQPSEMSFSVRCTRCHLEYSGRSLGGLVADPRVLLRWSYYELLSGVVRFNRWARHRPSMDGREQGTLETLVKEVGLSEELLRHYLVPMTSAIWSSTASDARRMPADFFFRFFQNHGLLQLWNRPRWRTISGGSRRYVDALAHPFRKRVHTTCAVSSVACTPNGASVSASDGRGVQQFDRVVIATHADQALRLLHNPDRREAQALASIPYRRNEVVLHTDPALLPRAKRAWSSWNYHMPDCDSLERPLQMTYYLNRLHQFTSNTPYCVTLNATTDIDPTQVLGRYALAHPVFTAASLRARDDLNRNDRDRRVHFCGAYLGNGFHEDGVRAGLKVAQAIDPEAEVLA